MQLSGLVWGQHHEVEKPVSINRSRDLRAGDSGSCRTEQGKALFGTKRRGHSIRLRYVIISDQLGKEVDLILFKTVFLFCLGETNIVNVHKALLLSMLIKSYRSS